MSKIGKKPITIPEGIKIDIKDGFINISGNSKEFAIKMLSGVKVSEENGEVVLKLKENSKQSRSNWGTLRSLIANAIEGIIEGFEKTLILEGVGYRMKKEGNKAILSLGYSHKIEYEEPEGIEIEIDEKANALTVKGADKAMVGQVAAEIRAFRKVEPYKGKGFRYKGEVVRRKAGKKAATGAGA